MTSATSATLTDLEQRAKKIRLAIFDVDGVLTDGSLFYGDDGQEYKAFNSLDGHGLKMLRRSGVALAIITGRNSTVVVHRALNLGVEHVYQGAEDKLVIYQQVLEDLSTDAEHTAYMGDDVVDLPVLKRCGLAVCVPQSVDLVRRHVHYVTERSGGRGAAREVCELIMRAQGTYDEQMAPYLA